MVPHANGFESWRMIVREFEPRVLSRRLGLLRNVLHPSFGPEESFLDALLEWEAALQRYEALVGNVMDDLTKMAV
eukprot:1960801-Lingulodinium_polyedra.AAC.1